MLLKKLLCVVSLCSICSLAEAAPKFMIVQCNMNPATSFSLPASYSDPGTGAMMQAATCGEALAKVPECFVLEKGNSAGTNGVGMVNYIFSNICYKKSSKSDKAS